MTRVAGQRARCIKAHLQPILVGIGVARVLQFPDCLPITIHQGGGHAIAAGMGGTARIAIPPVAHRYIRRTSRHREVLADAIVTTAVATEVGTVIAAMWIRRVDELIARARRFLPWVNTLFKAAILDQ